MTVDDIATAHQWHGGYVCTCGHEVNSPRGFTAHVLEVAGTDAALAAVGRVEAALDPGELECVRLGLPCRDVSPADRWCRACRLTDALDVRSAGSTRDGSASPEDPVAGRLDLLREAHRRGLLPLRMEGRVMFACKCAGVERHARGNEEWTVVNQPCGIHLKRATQDPGPSPVPMPTWDRNGPTGEAMA